jgi:hypothetical protein
MQRQTGWMLTAISGAALGLALPGHAAGDSVRGGDMQAKAQYPGSRLLRAGDVVVEVMDPNAAERYNRGVRFTPVAAVIRADAGTNEFFMHEAEHDPLTAVAGLFAEFDLITPPPGFTEAKQGDGYVKVGVGVLAKDEENYRFWPQHPLLKAARTEVEWGASTAKFHQVCEPCNGYGYELGATVAVGASGTIAVDWRLRNSGTKTLETQQYAHNCFQLNRQPVGPDYVLEFPYDFAARKLQSEQRQEGRAIRFAATIPTAVNIDVDYPAAYTGPNTLAVRHTRTGQAVECLTSVPGTRTAVHASKIYLCPEQFIALRLKPGESAAWTRRYTLVPKQASYQ